MKRLASLLVVLALYSHLAPHVAAARHRSRGGAGLVTFSVTRSTPSAVAVVCRTASCGSARVCVPLASRVSSVQLAWLAHGSPDLPTAIAWHDNFVCIPQVSIPPPCASLPISLRVDLDPQPALDVSPVSIAAQLLAALQAFTPSAPDSGSLSGQLTVNMDGRPQPLSLSVEVPVTTTLPPGLAVASRLMAAVAGLPTPPPARPTACSTCTTQYAQCFNLCGTAESGAPCKGQCDQLAQLCYRLNQCKDLDGGAPLPRLMIEKQQLVAVPPDATLITPPVIPASPLIPETPEPTPFPNVPVSHPAPPRDYAPNVELFRNILYPPPKPIVALVPMEPAEQQQAPPPPPPPVQSFSSSSSSSSASPFSSSSSSAAPLAVVTDTSPVKPKASASSSKLSNTPAKHDGVPLPGWAGF